MPRPPPITLQDIATRAGVSKMTVSLALRGHPHAAAKTQERIRALAAEMGYRPNPLVVANMAQLRAGRRSSYAGTIAFLGPGKSPEPVALGAHNGNIFTGARRRAESLGYQLKWFSLAQGITGSRLSSILKARGIFGVVLSTDLLLPDGQQLDWSQFALAATGRTEIGHEIHRTTGDYYPPSREACQRCRDRGYRRIGLAISREHDTAHQGLHRSAMLGCQHDWPEEDRVPVWIGDPWSVTTFTAWWRRHRPDVVIASSDEPLFWLRASGRRVPEDVGFLRPHVANRELGACGFLFDEAEIGGAAVDLVVEQLNHNERGIPKVVKRVLLPGRWYEGQSLRPARST